MLQNFRTLSQGISFKILLVVICITLIASLGIGSFFGQQKDVLATVNSEELLVKDFQRLYQQRVNSLREQLGANAEETIKQLNLQKATLRFLVDQHLVQQQAEKLGIQVTDLELQEYIHKQPGFSRNEKFDFEIYKEVLKQNRLTPYDYERFVRQDLLIEKYYHLLHAGVSVSDAQIEQAFRLANQRTEVDYLYFPPQLFESKVVVNNEQIQKFYQEHLAEYKSSRRFKIKYFLLTASQTSQEELVKDREIQRYYERSIDQYTQPASVKARHILVKADPNLPETERQEKRKKADALLAQLKTGASFEELAKAESEDITKEQGGDLGWFKSGEMVQSVEQAAFALNPGELSGVVESPFGYHIIRVDEKKEKIVQSMESVREEIQRTLAERRAENKLELEFKRVGAKLDAEKDFAQLAQSSGGAVQESLLFGPDDIIPGIGSTQSLIVEMKEPKVGTRGKLQRNPVQGHVFYEVTEIQEPQDQPLTVVHDRVLKDLIQHEAQMMAVQAAKAGLEQLKQGKILEDIGTEYKIPLESTQAQLNNTYMPKVGSDEDFRKAVFALKESNRYGYSDHEGKTYLIRLKQTSYDPAGQTRDAITTQLVAKQKQDFVTQELKQLRSTSNVKILNSQYKADYESSL